MEDRMFSLVNKHEEYFDFLVTNSEYFKKGTQMVKAVLQDPSRLEKYSEEIRNIEKAADEVTHSIAEKMQHVFITPIDREDFYLLTSSLDDCVDDIQDVIMSLKLYHAGIGWELPFRMADILIDMSGEMIVLFRLLKDIDKNEQEILQRARKLNELESEGDEVYRKVIFDLFDGTHEVMEIIRWKEIMEAMENACDQAEKVANLIKEVVMKYA
jgi:predicted phosphate transport protein (TIGR00153 family)